MGKHTDHCKPDCNDSHDAFDHASRDHWGDSGVDREPRKGPCFIATAVYGDTMAPEVVSLRRFRDDVLRHYALGRRFIATYYRTSPPVADWLKSKPIVSRAVRALLDRIVRLIP